MPELRFEDLVFAYPCSGSHPALNGASGRLGSNNIVGLVGKNGAGKSTLSKVLNGVLRPRTGILWLGREPIQPVVRPGHVVAYAFQNPDDQLFLATVCSEVAFGPRNLGMGREETDEAVKQALEDFDLRSFAQEHPLDLPFVLRKRVAMASAIAARRPWTVLDEPTLGQDAEFCDRLVRVLKGLQAEGRGAILISHDPEFVFEVCDRILVMGAGKCTWCGSPGAFVAECPPEASGFLNLPGKLVLDLGLPQDRTTRGSLAAYLRERDDGSGADKRVARDSSWRRGQDDCR